ncbi:MAG: hypothetical protein ACK56I_13850, partial [bacterium]
QRHHQAVAPGAGLAEQAGIGLQPIAGGDQQPDTAADSAPALDPLGRLGTGRDLAGREATGLEHLEQLLLPRRGDAGLAGDDAGGQRAETARHRHGQPGREARSDRREQGIHRPGPIHHLDRVARQVADAA